VRGQNCYKGVTGGKELELSPLSGGICQQSLVQIKAQALTDSSKQSMLDYLLTESLVAVVDVGQ